MLFQDAQLSSSEFAKAKHGPEHFGDAMDITLADGGIETRIIYENECLPACSQGTGQTELFGRDRVQILVRDELACAREFDLAILGGCCGTDEHYIDALAKAVVG